MTLDFRKWWRCSDACGVVFSTPSGHELLLCPVCRARCEIVQAAGKRPGRDLLVSQIRRALEAALPDEATELAREMERWLNGACRKCQKRLPFTKMSERTGVCPQCRGGERNSIHARRKRAQRECAHEWERPASNYGSGTEMCLKCGAYRVQGEVRIV